MLWYVLAAYAVAGLMTLPILYLDARRSPLPFVLESHIIILLCAIAWPLAWLGYALMILEKKLGINFQPKYESLEERLRRTF